MRWLLAAFCAVALALPPPAVAQQTAPKTVKKKDQKKRYKRVRHRIERLACRLGTEDRHARIAVELRDGRINRFAYYSKWKPRTCSMEVERDDAYSTWEDSGNLTVVTLIEDKGAFLIDHERGRYHFIFREIDRMRYCGMEGKVSGSLTIYRGRSQCVLEGVMDRGVDSMETDSDAAALTSPSASAGENAK
jgi:hypothetical protein